MAEPYWHAQKQDDPQSIIDRPMSINCPRCGVVGPHLTAISTPRWTQVARYQPNDVIVGYRCGACGGSVALRFKTSISVGNGFFELSPDFDELERPMETFAYQHLPEAVAADFREALTCYSNLCPNATAAMCRRTIQSAAEALGASGTDKVKSQILEIKETAGIDDDTFTALKQAMIDGYDGAHPHLPCVTKARAEILVAVMKDVLYQLFVRQGLVREAMRLRQEAIADKKAT